MHFGIVPGFDDFTKFAFVSETFGSIDSKGFSKGLAQ